jgi:hypothetical protein
MDLLLQERDRDRAEYFALMTNALLASISAGFGNGDGLSKLFASLKSMGQRDAAPPN